MSKEIRNVGEITINDKRITVRELTIREIISIVAGSKEDIIGGKMPTTFKDGNALKDYFGGYISKFLLGVTVDDFLDMTPSEVSKIYEKFKEINSAFFEVALSMGLTELLQEMKKSIQKDFSKMARKNYLRLPAN